jgi:hypothetical protein
VVSTNIKEFDSAMVDPFQKGGFTNNGCPHPMVKVVV